MTHITCNPRTLLSGALLGATLALAAPFEALAGDIGTCPNFPDPAITINPSFTPPRYNFNQSLSRLQQIAEVESAALLHKDTPVGLSVGELSVGVTMQANAAYGSDGHVCAKPAAITIDVGFNNNTIYVAKELVRRTCGHSEILAHEEEHVNIDRELLKEYEPVMARYMNAAARQLGTVRAKSTEEAEQVMQGFINDHLQDMANEINAERKKRQAKHDSREEYERLAKVCDGAVTQIVNQIKGDDVVQKKKSSFGYYPSRNPQLPTAEQARRSGSFARPVVQRYQKY